MKAAPWPAREQLKRCFQAGNIGLHETAKGCSSPVLRRRERWVIDLAADAWSVAVRPIPPQR